LRDKKENVSHLDLKRTMKSKVILI